MNFMSSSPRSLDSDVIMLLVGTFGSSDAIIRLISRWSTENGISMTLRVTTWLTQMGLEVQFISDGFEPSSLVSSSKASSASSQWITIMENILAVISKLFALFLLTIYFVDF